MTTFVDSLPVTEYVRRRLREYERHLGRPLTLDDLTSRPSVRPLVEQRGIVAWTCGEIDDCLQRHYGVSLHDGHRGVVEAAT